MTSGVTSLVTIVWFSLRIPCVLHAVRRSSSKALSRCRDETGGDGWRPALRCFRWARGQGVQCTEAHGWRGGAGGERNWLVGRSCSRGCCSGERVSSPNRNSLCSFATSHLLSLIRCGTDQFSWVASRPWLVPPGDLQQLGVFEPLAAGRAAARQRSTRRASARAYRRPGPKRDLRERAVAILQQSWKCPHMSPPVEPHHVELVLLGMRSLQLVPSAIPGLNTLRIQFIDQLHCFGWPVGAVEASAVGELLPGCSTQWTWTLGG